MSDFLQFLVELNKRGIQRKVEVYGETKTVVTYFEDTILKKAFFSAAGDRIFVPSDQLNGLWRDKE